MMNRKISEWHRLMLVTAGMASVAWRQGAGLYQQHLDGSIWEYAGIPCSGSVCSGWLRFRFGQAEELASSTLRDGETVATRPAGISTSHLRLALLLLH